MEASERFRELWMSLSRLQRQYVAQALDYGTKAEAAEAIGLKPNTVYKWGRQVDEAVALLQMDLMEGAREGLRTAVARAAMVKIDGLDEADARLRQSVASEILDRVLGKASVRADEGEGVSEIRVIYEDEERE